MRSSCSRISRRTGSSVSLSSETSAAPATGLLVSIDSNLTEAKLLPRQRTRVGRPFLGSEPVWIPHRKLKCSAETRNQADKDAAHACPESKMKQDFASLS